MTITDFLLARIAEDEFAAAVCPPSPWRVSTIDDEAAAHDEDTCAGETVTAADGIVVAVPRALSGPQTRAVRDHVVRHDPARVLAECAAKRSCIDDAWCDHLQIDGEWGMGRGQEHLERSNDVPAVVSALAAVYADHPDYDQAWAAAPA